MPRQIYHYQIQVGASPDLQKRKSQVMKHQGFTVFAGLALADLWRFRKNSAISFDVLKKQVLFTGVEAAGLSMLIAMLLGALIIVEGYQFLGVMGQTQWIYKILIFALVRDLGPFIVCFIVLARSGTAITTELGNMVVAKEVDALVAMGVSPFSYLVAPRVLGMILSLLLLMSYFLVSGVFGGFLVSNLFQSIPFADFVNQVLSQLHYSDIIVMLVKVSVSGFFISLISCYHGLTVMKAITEVPQRNIKAVGRGVVAVCAVNFVAALLYYFSTGVLGG